ncbi:hypothetical protein [Asticcacaulis endophyticus]|uniref:Uncharacterized protein n=1 Tax=Asticcacaulis endophyticus TaxID=1395890 RepID=A0A918UN39_9CAUL|nr:hypothetical protein [Asticcacaulis endophyticus]GGZ22063.1 hypothetical protein GCM10011273_03600 [Asticcacaulis endophyticus]
MSKVMIHEWRCDAGCGAKHQSEEHWTPEGWLAFRLGEFGKKGTEHFFCPECRHKVEGLIAGGEHG